MRKTFLPASLPLIGKEETDEVLNTLTSGWLTTGPLTKSFEESFCKYIGSKYAVAVSSCTAGLHLSLLAAGVEKNDEIITTPYTFAATINTILHCQAKPVLVDINKKTYNIDVKKIESSITKSTKAIVPVHFAGQPCEMEEIRLIAKKYNLFVIEDAAHAAGAFYKGVNVGVSSDLHCFSFYPAKNMTTGEGGMVTTDDEELANKIRLYSQHGMSRDAWKRYNSEGSWHYDIVYPGFKYNMTDIQAAIGIHQLKKLDEFIKIRTNYAQMFSKEFAKYPSLIVPEQIKNIKHAWYLYPILLNLEELNITRNEFINELKELNIGTSVHFIPNHIQPYYRDTFGYKQDDFSVAQWVYEREISLPLYPKMTEQDVNDVINAVLNILKSHKKL